MFPFTFGFVLARYTDAVQPDIVCFSALLSSCETLGISWHSNNMTKHSPTSNVTALKMCDQVIWSDLNQQKNMRHRNSSSPQGQDYKNIKNIFSISPYSIDIRRRTLTYMWKVLKSTKLFGLLTGQTLEHSGESSWCTMVYHYPRKGHAMRPALNLITSMRLQHCELDVISCNVP